MWHDHYDRVPRIGTIWYIMLRSDTFRYVPIRSNTFRYVHQEPMRSITIRYDCCRDVFHDNDRGCSRFELRLDPTSIYTARLTTYFIISNEWTLQLSDINVRSQQIATERGVCLVLDLSRLDAICRVLLRFNTFWYDDPDWKLIVVIVELFLTV